MKCGLNEEWNDGQNEEWNQKFEYYIFMCLHMFWSCFISLHTLHTSASQHNGASLIAKEICSLFTETQHYWYSLWCVITSCILNFTIPAYLIILNWHNPDILSRSNCYCHTYGFSTNRKFWRRRK